jgi:DNA-binding protein YbaB
VLEDLIVTAHNEAKTKAEQMMQQKMAELTQGLQLPPGMKLPF